MTVKTQADKNAMETRKMFSVSRIKSGCPKITARLSVKFRLTNGMRRGGEGEGEGGDSLPGVKALIKDTRTVYVSFVLEIETPRAGARKGEGCLSAE